MRFYRGIVFALAAVAAAPFSAAAADRPQSFDELATGADKIVLGTVASKGSRWADDGHIYTDVLVSPDVTIKGADEGPVTVEVLGGTVGDTTMTVSDGPEFPYGQQVVAFLRREGARYVVLGRAAGAVAAGSAEAAAAVESGFRAAERGSARRFEYRRGLAESYLSRTVAHAATQTGCYSTDGAKWDTNSATYKIGTSIPAGWAASIDASTATWNGAKAGFTLINDPNSVNELSYKDLVATYGSSYSNVFAVTTTWSSTSTGKISKATIEVNTKWPWSTSGAANMADVQNILTHEFGHWMRLLDIYSPTTCSEVTMWGSAGYGETKKRTLEQADLDGFFSLYGGGSTTVAAPVLASPANGATGVSSTAPLVWNAAANATSYDVYFGTSASPSLVATVTATTYQPGTLTAGVTYYWKVVAKNATGTATSGTYSFTVVSGTVAAPALTSPANGATGVSSTASVVWSAAANATSYDVYFGTSATPALVATVTVTTYQPGTLTAGATYYWKVVAKNATGTAASATYSFKVGTATVGAPALTSPANGATGVAKTTALVWAAAANATSYDVYFGTSATPALVTNLTGTTYQPPTLADGTTYYWRIVAKNAAGTATSATYSFTTAPAASPVGTPTLTSPANGATGIGTSVTLVWTAAANATSYDIYFGTTATPALAATTSATTIQASNMAAGTTYYWRIVAKNASGSATSATFSFKVGTATTSSTVTLLSPANGATGVSLRPVMQWSAVSGATAYDLYVGATSTPGYIGTVNATSVTVMGFQAKTTYYWKVVARTASGTVSSAVWSFKTN